MMDIQDQTAFKSSGLQFQYSEKSTFALSSGAFEILAGQTLAVIGPSGDGKSTLLRLIEGSLTSKNSSAVPSVGRTALIYQDLRLVSEKTALENTLMGALARQTGAAGFLQGFSQELQADAKALLTELGLDQHMHQHVSMLSGGQQQRVAIARALMSRPLLLLADEPFSHLDHETALETFRLLRQLQAKFGFAMLISIHSNELSDFAFDQVWKVVRGKLILAHPMSDGPAGEAALEDVNAEQTDAPGAFSRVAFKQNLLIAGVASVAILCAIYLPTDGFTADGAWVELKSFFGKIFLPDPSDLARVNWDYLFKRMLLTMQMALIGTSLGFVISWPLSFLSAEGISVPWLSWPLRFLLMCLRSVPALVWALFFVAGLGLGAVSGIAALSLYSIGYFTKLLYEGVEDLDRKPFYALRALGASRPQAVRHAILPSSKPLLITSFIFMLEYNVRSASLLGLVGAGGIGQDLIYAIEWRNYPTVFAILVLIVAVVLAFDQASVFARTNLRKLRGI